MSEQRFALRQTPFPAGVAAETHESVIASAMLRTAPFNEEPGTTRYVFSASCSTLAITTWSSSH
jgi:hypothetical protein